MANVVDPQLQRSLMEKWKEHFQNRDFRIKPEKGNTAGVTFFWCYTLSLAYTSYFILIPEVAKNHHKTEFWMKAFVLLLFVESVVNWLLTARKWVSQATPQRVGQDSTQRRAGVESDWRMCLTCQLAVPPRSHHCKLCQMCVLKRDHHCFFTGTCVGFNNQRHFVVYSFYILLGSLFGIFLVFAFLNDPLPFWKWRSFICYIPPVAVWQWICGYLPSLTFLLLLQMYLGFITLVTAGGYFLWEMGVIYSGQTSYEAGKGIHRYQVTTVFQNFRSVFGPFWLLNFIVPLPTSQEGNGIDWETRKAVKGY